MVRTEEALQQPTLPTIFKEIHSRAQTSFSLRGSCETPSPVTAYSIIISEGLLTCSCWRGHSLGPQETLVLVWGPEEGHCNALTWAGLLCHACSMCLFLPSPESLKWGVTPLCKLQSGWMLRYRSWSFFVGRPWHLPFFYKAKLTLSLGEITETHPFAKSGLTPAVDGGASIPALFSLAGAAQAAEKHHRGPSHALQRLQLHTLESKATAQRQFLPTASN